MSGSGRRLAHFALAVAAIAACSKSDAPTAIQPSAQGITAVAGAAYSDTALVTPLQALVVEVRGPGGALAKGSTVRFSVRATADTTRRYQATLFACRLSASTCGTSSLYGALTDTVAVDTADANGRAKVLVRLGTVAGPAWMIVSVPEFGMKDSVSFTVKPGAAQRVRFAVRDTNLVVGGRATPRASVYDAYGNARTDAVTYALGTSGATLTIDPATSVITAGDIGQGTVLGRSGSAVDTMTVRVVPAARLLVWDNANSAVRMFSSDGSAMRTLVGGVNSSFGAYPHFSPSGTVVAAQTATVAAYATPQRIVIVDSSGTNARTVDLPSGLGMMTQPRPMADGTVRFVGRVVTSASYSNVAAALYSIAANNAVTKVADLPNMLAITGGADISPDGTRVAYLVSDANSPYAYYGRGTLQVVTVATGQVTTLEANVSAPSWSPQGDRLAYLVLYTQSYVGPEGALVVANPDGSNRTTFGTQSVFSPGLGWSPTGAYVVGRLGPNYANYSGTQETGLRAVRLRDAVGVTFRLPSVTAAGAVVFGAPGDYAQPDWR